MMDSASFQQKLSIQPLINNVGWEYFLLSHGPDVDPIEHCRTKFGSVVFLPQQ